MTEATAMAELKKLQKRYPERDIKLVDRGEYGIYIEAVNTLQPGKGNNCFQFHTEEQVTNHLA